MQAMQRVGGAAGGDLTSVFRPRLPALWRMVPARVLHAVYSARAGLLWGFRAASFLRECVFADGGGLAHLWDVCRGTCCGVGLCVAVCARRFMVWASWIEHLGLLV